jgi:hypothetical protein
VEKVNGSRGLEMGEARVNVDEFVHRPTHHVVGVLGSESDLPALVNELEQIGVPTEEIDVLCGQRGAEILDPDGRYHGRRARLVRGFQRLGYDQTTLEIYDEALRRGGLLLHVPAKPGDSHSVARILWRHRVEDIGYFGTGTFEQFTFPPETDPRGVGAPT